VTDRQTDTTITDNNSLHLTQPNSNSRPKYLATAATRASNVPVLYDWHNFHLHLVEAGTRCKNVPLVSKNLHSKPKVDQFSCVCPALLQDGQNGATCYHATGSSVAIDLVRMHQKHTYQIKQCTTISHGHKFKNFSKTFKYLFQTYSSNVSPCLRVFTASYKNHK